VVNDIVVKKAIMHCQSKSPVKFVATRMQDFVIHCSMVIRQGLAKLRELKDDVDLCYKTLQKVAYIKLTV
jgi:hypothetical protein